MEHGCSSNVQSAPWANSWQLAVLAQPSSRWGPRICGTICPDVSPVPSQSNDISLCNRIPCSARALETYKRVHSLSLSPTSFAHIYLLLSPLSVAWKCEP
ncbi:hypothetical protein Ancab_015718 [Ancistrocladus abbreviatus]